LEHGGGVEEHSAQKTVVTDFVLVATLESSATKSTASQHWLQRPLVLVAILLTLAVCIWLWLVLLDTKHERHTRHLYEFTQTLGNLKCGIGFRAEDDLSDITMAARIGTFSFYVRLTFLILIQAEILLLLWWRIKVRDPERHLAKLATRLFRTAGAMYLLGIILPTAEDSSDPISGFGLIRHWFETVFSGYYIPDWNDVGDYTENLCFLWMLPVMLGPPFLFFALFIELPLRRKFGVGLAALLSVNSLALTVNTFLGTNVDFTYGIVLLGLANACGALAVLTKVIEIVRFDAKWQATLEESPM
jgi:hypothetical protein